MAHSMSVYHSSFHLIPAEKVAEAQEKMALLIYNLSHLSTSGVGGTSVGDVANLKGGLAAGLATTGWNIYSDAFLQGIVSEMDRKLDMLPDASSTASTMVLYATLALVMGYSQRQVGREEYKMEIRRRLEEGDFDVDKVSDT